MDVRFCKRAAAAGKRVRRLEHVWFEERFEFHERFLEKEGEFEKTSRIEAGASAEGADARPNYGDSVGARAQWVLPGPAEREVGREYGRRDAEISVGEWAGVDRQVGRAFVAETRAGIERGGSFGAAAAGACGWRFLEWAVEPRAVERA